LKSLISVLFAFLLMGCVISESLIKLDPVVELQSRKVDEYIEKYPNSDAVFFKNYSSYEYSSAWYYDAIIEKEYMIINPENNDYTSVNYTFSANEILKTIQLLVLYPDGIKKEFQLADMRVEDNSSGGKTYKLAFPNIVKGTIVYSGYAYSVSNSRPELEMSFVSRHRIPIEDYKVQIVFPSLWEYRVKETNQGLKPVYQAIRKEEMNKKKVTYRMLYNQPLKEESYSPSKRETIEFFDFMFTYVTDGNNYYIVAPKSWDELLNQYESHFIDREAIFATKVSSITSEIIQECKTDKEKMEAIVEYIQDNIEIDNDHSVKDFSEMLKKNKGSIPMITGLTYNMLSKAGLDATVILVHDADDGYLDKNYYSFSQINTPAISVRIEGEDYYMFPYLKYLEIGEIPDNLSGQFAVKVLDNMDPRIYEKEKESIIINLPVKEAQKFTINEDYSLKIDEEGLIHVKEVKEFNSIFSFFLREVLKEKKDEDRQKYLKSILTYEDTEVEIDSVEIVNENDYRKPLVIKMNYKIENLVTVTPEEVIFQTGGLFSPVSMKMYLLDTEKRENPIKINYGYDYNKKISISFPENWKVETELKEISLENKFGKVTKKSKIEGNTLFIDQTSSLYKSSAPKEEITELLKIRGKSSILELPAIIFSLRE